MTGPEEFTVLHSNVREFISRVAELSARLQLKTWADKASQQCALRATNSTSRYDRADGRQGGGVAVFALEKLAHKDTHLGDSTVAERSWVNVHSDHGSYVGAGTDRPNLERIFHSQAHAAKDEASVVLGDILTSIVGGGCLTKRPRSAQEQPNPDTQKQKLLILSRLALKHDLEIRKLEARRTFDAGEQRGHGTS